MNSPRLCSLLVVFMFFISSCGVTRRGGNPGNSARSSRNLTVIETGVASWYGPNFHGRLTANGETFDMNGVSAAHRTLPFDTEVVVENLDNGRTVRVRINDRGPYADNRIIDLSRAAAEQLDMIGPGTARVRLYVARGIIDPASLSVVSTSNYTVQLGSYDAEEAARRRAAEVSGSRVVEVVDGGNTFFRVYYGLFDNPSIAGEAQQRLEGLGFTGFVKQVENN